MNFLRQDPIQKEIDDILKDLGKVINKRSNLPDSLKNIVHEMKEKLEKGGYPPSGVAAPVFPTEIQRSMARIYVLALQSDKLNYRKSALIKVYWLARDAVTYKHGDSTPALNGLQLMQENRESIVQSLNAILQNDPLGTEEALMCCITLAHLGYTDIKDTVVRLLSATPSNDMKSASYFLNACCLLKIPDGLPLAYAAADAFRKFPSGNGIGRIPFKESMDLFAAILNDNVIDYLEKMIKDFYRELKGKEQGLIIGALTRLWVPHHGLEIIFEHLPQSQNKRVIQILAEFVKDAIPLQDEVVLSSKKRPDGSEERMIQFILGNRSIKDAARRIVSKWNDSENVPAWSVLERVVTQVDLQSLMGKQFVIKKGANIAETLEVPNTWGIGDGEPFVILVKPNIPDIFAKLNRSESIEKLYAYLKHPDRQVRIATLEQARNYKIVNNQQAVVDALSDPENDVRVAAANALWVDFSAVKFALACLRDEFRGYNSFGTATASTMTANQALEGVEILRRAAPTPDDSERFETVYDDLWNEEQRAEAERAAYRAKQSQIEDIKKRLSSAELDAIRATMTDVEQQFDIGDVFLNKKIEEKYLHQQDESPTDAVESSKAEPQAVLTEERSPAAHPIPEPATQTKPSEGEILCPYCETYIVPQEIGGQFYCPNDGRVLDRSAQTKPSEGEILCPYCETYIVPQEIGGQFYCPNDGRVLDVSVGTAALKNTPEQIVTVYCDDCGRKVVSGGNASIPEQCPYCNSRNLTHTGNTTS